MEKSSRSFTFMESAETSTKASQISDQLGSLVLCSSSSSEINYFIGEIEKNNMFKDMNMVSYLVVFLCVVAISALRSEASEFTVGGGNGWSVPSGNSSNPFNQWAEKMRFLIGDSLVFAYQPNQDSVLYVTKDAYDGCKTDSYITKYVDGHTVFKFNQSGPFHFISGNKDNCLKNEKLVVIVLADRTKKTGTPSPSPSPSEGGGSPSTTPSPAPSGEESPSPPAGTVDINPSPAPTSEATPPAPKSSGSRSALVGVAGSIAAFAATSALLAL